MRPDHEMSLEAEVVRDVRIGRGLKLEAVAMATGVSTSHIDRMELGQATVTIPYVRALFRATRDLRLIQLIEPDALPLSPELASSPPARPQRTPPAGDPRELLPPLLGALKDYALVAETGERVLRDGSVDERDDHLLATIQEHGNRVCSQIGAFNVGLVAWRDADARARQQNGRPRGRGSL